jgi:hypothetical protein
MLTRVPKILDELGPACNDSKLGTARLLSATGPESEGSQRARSRLRKARDDDDAGPAKHSKDQNFRGERVWFAFR